MTECERIIEQGILPPEFFKPEVRNDFLVDETRKKLWAIEIDLLLELDRVCKKHSLKYYLIVGSLLGAVRHKGFIPWDDDIDVAMMRDDYKKLISLAEEFKSPYFLQTPYTDSEFFFSFCKLRNSNTSFLNITFLFQNYNHGVPIDIFPIDNVKPEDFKQNFERIRELNLANSTYMRISNPYLSEQDKKRVSEYKGGNPMERYETIQHIAKQYNNEETKNVAIIVITVYDSERLLFKREDFTSSISREFEGFKFPIPIGYEHILTTNYGDYMSFPPVEERGTWHKNIIPNPDVPYKDLVKQYRSHSGVSYYSGFTSLSSSPALGAASSAISLPSRNLKTL